MDELEFLQTVVTTDSGRFCLSIRAQNIWQNLWYDWPNESTQIIETAHLMQADHDVYFSSYLSSCDDASKTCALPTRTIIADLDNAQVDNLSLPPTLMTQTSDRRHQGFWILTEEIPNHEAISRRLTYSIVDADPTGWPIGKKVRFPGTHNYKYDPPPIVEVTSYTGKLYRPDEFEDLPDIAHEKAKIDIEFVTSEIPTCRIGPLELLESIKHNVPAKVYAGYKITSSDRSAALWGLMCSAFRAGLDRSDVLFLAYHSANNKFSNVRDLTLDVLRAEREAFVLHEDARTIMDGIRKTAAPYLDKNRLLLATSIELMRRIGEFVATSDDDQWYVIRDEGRPIHLDYRSERLNIFLDSKFGFNYTDREAKYIMSGLNTHAKQMPPTGTLAQLSHYDAQTNSLMLHTGRKTVLRITPNSVEPLANGAHGLIFPWLNEVDQFNPTLEAGEWGTPIFGDSLKQITNIEYDEGMALLKVWMLSLLFRGDFKSKPLIAFFGSPGSGKSTIAKKIYAFLYGKQMKLGKITDDKSFDTAVSKYPLYIFDNVDTWERWLPDRLAQMAGDISSSKKKLYTDNDMVTVKGSAHVGVTSFDPKFNRPDVVDRFIVFIFDRIKEFMPEEQMVGSVLTNRNALWGHLIRDAQLILAQPRPTARPVQLRSSDLVQLGRWASTPLHLDAFESSVQKLLKEQTRITLREDQILAESLLAYVEWCPTSTIFKGIGRLWLDLTLYAVKGGIDANTILRRYKNAQVLDRRLTILLESLKTIVNIEWRDGISREWKITEKDS